MEEHIVELNKDIIDWTDKYQKYFPEGTFFDVAKHTSLGDNKYRFTLDKLCVFLLPLLEIKDVVDECSLSPELITELLIKIIIDISDDNFSLFLENKILNKHSNIIIDKLVEQIRQTDNYNFLYIFENFYDCHHYVEKNDCRKIIECCDKTDTTLLMWLCSVENTKYKSREKIKYFIFRNIKNLNLTSLNENNDTFLSILIKNKYRNIFYDVIEKLSKKKYKSQFDFLMKNVNKQNETILYLAYKYHSDNLVYDIHEKYSDTVDINIEIDISNDEFCNNNLLKRVKIGKKQSLLNYLCLRKYYGNIIKIFNTYPSINIGYADEYGNTLLILLCHQLTYSGNLESIDRYSHHYKRYENQSLSDDDDIDCESDTESEELNEFYWDNPFIDIQKKYEYIQTDPKYDLSKIHKSIIDGEDDYFDGKNIHQKILYTIYFIIIKFTNECNSGQPFRNTILFYFLYNDEYFILAYELLKHCGHHCNINYDERQFNIIQTKFLFSINKYFHVTKIIDEIVDKSLCSDEFVKQYLMSYIDLIYDYSVKSKLEYTKINTSNIRYIYSVKLIYQYKHILKTITIIDKGGLYLLMQLPFVTMNDIKCLVKNYRFSLCCEYGYEIENKFIIEILNICFKKNLKNTALRYILKLKQTPDYKFNIESIYTKNIILKMFSKKPLLLKQINISKYYNQ